MPALLAKTSGIVITEENVPNELAIMFAGLVTSLVLSNFIVIGPFAENPEPVIVTVAAGALEVLDNVIDGCGMLSIPDAVNKPSVADIVCAPGTAVTGMFTVVENVPMVDVRKIAGMAVMVLSSNLIVICSLAPKLEPDTVTVVPTTPEFGDTSNDGRVTLNVA
jgi:hypothetical protein